MPIKNFNIATVVGAATLMSMSFANAADMSLNAKELNGRTSYIGVAIMNSEIADIGFEEAAAGKNDIGTPGTHSTGKKAGFADDSGIQGTIGNDYGYVRVETEYSYRETTVNKLTGVNNRVFVLNEGNEVHIGSLMTNMAFEYSIDPMEMSGKPSSGVSITPFITVGGGVLAGTGNMSFMNTNSETDGVDEEMFAAPAVQGGAGLTLGLPFGVEVYGKYTELLGFTFNRRDTNDIHIKTVTGGLRLNF
jgi:hypothetical protein